MRKVSAVSLALAVVFAACGDSDDPEPSMSERDEPEPSITEEVVTAVNAAVPAGIDLTFEAAEWGDEDIAYLGPVGWKADEGADLTFSSDDFSIFTMYRLGKSCDGVCAPGKDWEARHEGLMSPVLDPDRYEVLDDRRLADPDGRTVVARARQPADAPGLFEPEIRIMTLRWVQEAPTYLECFVVLDGEDDQRLLDAFLAACEAAVALDFDALSVSFGSG